MGYRVYSRVDTDDDIVKHKLYTPKNTDRSSYVDTILDDLTPNDVRVLIKTEEELSQTQHFTRLFPNENSHELFKYYYEGIPYNDKLLDAWEYKYSNQRSKGIIRLKKLCAKAVHL